MTDKNNKNLQKTKLIQPPQPSEDKTVAHQTGPSAKKNRSKLSTVHQKALTQIDSRFQSLSTEQGFVRAKRDADRALAENRIILNNRFVLKETLGSGGMGTVYKAQDLRKVEARDNNPYVAAKILNNDFRNHPDAFISLQREASRSHLLSHPNIVTVHDFDRDGDTIFMTMELLDGEDLENLLYRYNDTGLEKEQALKILHDVCMALEFAHEKGIIHSDLKPGNIFVTKENDAKVLDFGIARLALESSQQDHFDAGKLGAITPAYASFEMIQREAPDARDDVFAAAIIAYELLTGKHPYHKKSAATAVAKGLTPTRPNNLSKRQWQALSKALQLKRNDRTKSIKEFLDGMLTAPKPPIYKLLSLVLLSMLSWFIYHQFFAPNELSLVIDETLVKATDCFEEKNYQCSIESANAILEIAPKHPIANELLKQAQINQLVENINACLSGEGSVKCAREQTDQLVKIAPNHAKISSMEKKIKALKINTQIKSLMGKASLCFTEKDFQCAISNASAILKIKPKHQQANELLQQSTKADKKQKLSTQQKNKNFKHLINKAQKCFDRAQYSCARNNAKRALDLKNSNQARQIIQNSNYAEKQYLNNLKKADKILADGRECLKKQDFSCAIAKSESALEFVPKYKKALQLKLNATKSLDDVKKNIKIE